MRLGLLCAFGLCLASAAGPTVSYLPFRSITGERAGLVVLARMVWTDAPGSHPLITDEVLATFVSLNLSADALKLAEVGQCATYEIPKRLATPWTSPTVCIHACTARLRHRCRTEDHTSARPARHRGAVDTRGHRSVSAGGRKQFAAGRPFLDGGELRGPFIRIEVRGSLCDPSRSPGSVQLEAAKRSGVAVSFPASRVERSLQAEDDAPVRSEHR